MAQKMLINGMERSLFRQYINDNFQELYAGGTGGGTTGKDGSTWYNGYEEPPTDTLGNDGDYFLNINNNNVYQKQDGSWIYLMYLKGDNGAPGEKGKDGSVWYTGKGVPDSMIGITGDFYLDGDNGNVYKRTPIEWKYQTNIKGPAGTGGTGGGRATSILTGEGLPGAILSANVSDYYIDNKSGDLYRYDDDGMMMGKLVWNMRGNIGTGGKDGSTWYNGINVPLGTQGVDGDYYLDTNKGDIYYKQTGNWILIMNIKGTSGTGGTSTNLIVKDEKPSMTDGALGDYCISNYNGDLYKKIDKDGVVSWELQGNIWSSNDRDITQTSNIHYGYEYPTTTVSTTMKNNDYYYYLNSYIMYQYVNNEFIVVANDTGIDKEGVYWYTGPMYEPDPMTGKTGDYYVNSSGDVYSKTNMATWEKVDSWMKYYDSYLPKKYQVGVLGGFGQPSDIMPNAVTNQLYVDFTSGDMYKKLNENWTTYSNKIYAQPGNPSITMMYAEIGCHYIDSDSGQLYRCTGINHADSTASWESVGSIGGGSDKNIYYNKNTASKTKGEILTLEVPRDDTMTSYSGYLVTIAAGQVVKASGNTPCMGVCVQSDETESRILVRGTYKIDEYTLTGFNIGDKLWLDTVTSQVTNVKPVAMGSIAQSVGYYLGDNVVYINISETYVRL